MKKNECNVVRDLMPLVLDRVASDESRELVETHISACENCRKKYEAMKADLPEAVRTEYECEQQKFVDALRNVRKKRLKRRILSICLAALICMVAAFGGLFAYDRLFHQHTVAVDNSLYSLSLSRLKDGSIVKGFANTYKRQNWDAPAYTIAMDNIEISSQNNVHPGRYIGKDENGYDLYSDARTLTLYELMKIMTLPDEWPLPEWVDLRFFRRVIGEGVPSLFMKKIFMQL